MNTKLIKLPNQLAFINVYRIKKVWLRSAFMDFSIIVVYEDDTTSTCELETKDPNVAFSNLENFVRNINELTN